MLAPISYSQSNRTPLPVGADIATNLSSSGWGYLAAFLLLASIPVSAQKRAPHIVTASAVYTGLDTAVQGNWSGNYGVNGNLIANDSAQPPAFVSISLTGAAQNTWAASTSDVRALQTAKGSSTRIASTYSSGKNYSF
jgi:hypothetical protein